MNVSVRSSIVPWGLRTSDSGTCRENLPVARMAQGVPYARLFVSMPLPSVASLTLVVPHGLHSRASDCSAAQPCMPFTVQHCPTPCPQNREWDASSGLRRLCARCWIANATGCPVSIKWDNCQGSFQGSCVCSSWAATLCSGSRCGSWAQPWANKWVGRPRGQCWLPCDKGCRKILPGGPISPPIERPPHRSFNFS